jgi:hypothetical protein
MASTEAFMLQESFEMSVDIGDMSGSGDEMTARMRSWRSQFRQKACRNQRSLVSIFRRGRGAP